MSTSDRNKITQEDKFPSFFLPSDQENPSRFLDVS